MLSHAPSCDGSLSPFCFLFTYLHNQIHLYLGIPYLPTYSFLAVERSSGLCNRSEASLKMPCHSMSCIDERRL